jgi:putative ABC transport system substrate-binding protein
MKRWPELVRELIEADVQVIVTSWTPAALALKERTTLPVVLLGVSHPVEAGLVQTLARPGGNITGVSNLFGDLDAKILQLCREVVPKVSRLALLWAPTNQGSALALKTMQSLATKEG